MRFVMSYDPDKDPEVIALRQQAKDAEAAAQARADGLMKDDALARAKGKTPEQIEARKRVAAVFCELHLSQQKPEEIQALLAAMDYDMTVSTTNGRNVDLENPKGSGFLGLGRKPVYLQSKAYPPADDQHPIYALEYFILET
jgi:hypothetical protein